MFPTAKARSRLPLLIPVLALFVTAMAARPADPLLGLWGVEDPEDGTGLYMHITETTITAYLDVGPGDCYHPDIADYTRDGDIMVIRSRHGDPPAKWTVTVVDGMLSLASDDMVFPPLPRADVDVSSLSICDDDR